MNIEDGDMGSKKYIIMIILDLKEIDVNYNFHKQMRNLKGYRNNYSNIIVYTMQVPRATQCRMRRL